MDSIVRVDRRAVRLDATVPVTQAGLDAKLRRALGTPKKALITPSLYGEIEGERFVGLDSINLNEVAMLSLAEWMDMRRKGQVFSGRLLGDGDMLAIFEQQERIPEKWYKKRNIAKPSPTNPDPEPVMVNPRVHFGGRVFGNHIPYMTYAKIQDEDGTSRLVWYAGVQSMMATFNSSCRLACLLHQ